MPCTAAPVRAIMRRDALLAPFSAIVSNTQRTGSARAVLYEPASLILQSNSRPPHSFAAQPGVFVAGHQCSAMAHTTVPLRQQAAARPQSSPTQTIPSLRRITCGPVRCSVHETLARVSMSLIGPVARRLLRRRLYEQTQPKTTLHSHEADCSAIVYAYFISTAMSGSIHGCDADVALNCRRCRIPHLAIHAQGSRVL